MIAISMDYRENYSKRLLLYRHTIATYPLTQESCVFVPFYGHQFLPFLPPPVNRHTTVLACGKQQPSQFNLLLHEFLIASFSPCHGLEQLPSSPVFDVPTL